MKSLPRILVLFLMALGFPVCGWPQTHVINGTVVVIGRTKDQIVVAADSRGLTESGYRDSDCKISAFGNKLAFATAGLRRFSSSTQVTLNWDSHETAQQVSLDRTKSVEQIAQEWGASSVDMLRSLVSTNPADFIRQTHIRGNVVSEGIFAGVNPNGEISANYAKIIIDPATGILSYGLKRNEMGSSPVHWEAFGESEIANEFLQNQTSRAQSGWAKWKSVSDNCASILALCVGQLVKWTIEYGSHDVGGQIDEIRIDNFGTHWLRRKQSCAKSL